MAHTVSQSKLLDELRNPPREFSLLPFWFWNDELSKDEILRQIDDFEAHGVYGFIIHPRVGLPRSIGWMSDAMLDFMSFAIDEAARRDMRVILYDEGMYPSGSSCGQVVATDPNLAARCLAMFDGHGPVPAGANVVARRHTADGNPITVIDRKADSVIRGLHYTDETAAAEDSPPAGDILNPATTAMVLKLVYDKFYQQFGKHFGKTILGVFTDEPNPLGRLRERGVFAGTTGILPHLNELLGYDFTPHLPALWLDTEPNAAKFRADYKWAIHRRLEQTWYRPLSEWCAAHGVALCGHPDAGDEIGVQRFFHYPGQDLVWRWVLPNHPTALEGPESTQGKCSSSAMLHHGRRRNSNEFCGAYGSETTFEEFKWLADWCFVRGVNLLVPHAFYYSVRGPRRDERPPQVGGVGCNWWDQFKPFADHCRRLSWLNTDSKSICDVAILANPDHCPWPAAKVCFQNQRDFNYLEIRSLKDATMDQQSLSIAGQTYGAVIVDGALTLDTAMRSQLAPLAKAGRLIVFGSESPIEGALIAKNAEDLVQWLNRIAPPRIILDSPAPDLRIRQIAKDGEQFILFFNEGAGTLAVPFRLSGFTGGSWVDTQTAIVSPADSQVVKLAPFETALLWAE